MHNTAIVNYHIQSTERQAFHFDVGGVFGNLVSPELVPTKVDVRDLRGKEHSVDFARDGITFVRQGTQTSDFTGSSAWEAGYNEELQRLLADQIGAQEVVVFDHTVRVDDPDAPRQPARNVHNDYNAYGAEQRLIAVVGEARAQEFLNGHYGFVNVWRPIENPIRSSPLGFIHPASMTAEDWMTIELIYPDESEAREILGVAASDQHEWFYFSGMTPDEVVIFNTYDNQAVPHLAHSALDMENTGNVQIPRKSVESRTIVRYA